MVYSQTELIKAWTTLSPALLLLLLPLTYLFFQYSDKSAFRHSDSLPKSSERIVIEKLNDQEVSFEKPEQIYNPQFVEKEKQPLIKFLILNFKDLTIDTDLIMRHVILIGFLLIDLISQILKKPSVSLYQSGNRSDSIKNKEIKDKLSIKTTDELKQILSGIELIDTFSHQELIEIIASSTDATTKLLTEEKREHLFKKTNKELRDLLIGVENISRLKKAQLVEMIILNQKNEIIN